MTNFSTIHIFGFGDTQIIGDTVNGTVPSLELTTLTVFVDHVKTFLPATGVTLTDYHVIHIFNNMDIRYLGQATEDRTISTSFSVNWGQIDHTLLTALVDEIISKLPSE